MESFKQFLETASINGLNHISSTRKWTRLFWITLVTLGFVASTYLIWESFQTWTENPIRTTTRTVPMQEIKFPKLTVCPPKNTFTDLNYDLMLAEEVSITNEKRNELYEYVVELIDEHVYMDPWDRLHEENRFLNWYKGFTSMHNEPYYTSNTGAGVGVGPLTSTYAIHTSAPSGVITSQYFGEKYNPSLVEQIFDYRIRVSPSKSIRYNENVTLHFEIERLSIPVQSGFDNFHSLNGQVPAKKKLFKISVSPPVSGDPILADSYKFTYDLYNKYQDEWAWRQMQADLSRLVWAHRYVNDKEISEAKLQMMPGFRVSWYYTGNDLKQDPLLEYPMMDKKDWTIEFKDNKEFIREANKIPLNILSFTCFINFLDL